MQLWTALLSFLCLSATSFAASPGNAIKDCKLEVSGKKETKTLEIPAQHPGALNKDGAYCDKDGMQIYKKFKAPDGSDWILSLYADIDRNQNTHFVHRVYESGTKEPPQIDLVLNQPPCGFLDKNGTGLSAQLSSTKGDEFSVTLACRK